MRPQPEYETAWLVHQRDHDLGLDHERRARPAGSPARCRGHTRRDRGDLGLLETVLLPAGRGPERDPGQRAAGQEPARPQDRRLRRRLAGPARRPRPGPPLVRATRTGARTAGSDPGPHPDDPRARADRAATGEAAGGHRDQAGRGRLRHHGRLGPGHAGGPHRRRTRPADARGPGQTQAPQQDPRTHRGPDRPASATTTPSSPGCTWTTTTSSPTPSDSWIRGSRR